MAFIPGGESNDADSDQAAAAIASNENNPTLSDRVNSRRNGNRNADAAWGESVGSDEGGPRPYGMKVNRNYIARIVQDGKMVAKGYLPETFTVSVNSHYDPPFGQGNQDGGAIGSALKIVGHTTLVSQSMTMQVWGGTDPIELQLDMEFLAESDPYTEVIMPIKKLMRLVMPNKTDGVGRLEPPGPKINWADTLKGISLDVLKGIGNASFEQAGNTLRNAQDAATGKISVFVGNFLTFDSVVITNVTQVYHSMFDAKGLPLRATVSVQFRTFLVPATSNKVDEDDLIRMFNGPSYDDQVAGSSPDGSF